MSPADPPKAGSEATPPKGLKRAGSRWRILVHQMLPKGKCGSSWDFSGEAGPDSATLTDGFLHRRTHLPGTEFDELVVGSWLHVEQMDTGCWWMNVGGVTVWVDVHPDGRPAVVRVYGPGDYADPVEGVVYGGPALADEWPPTDAAEEKPDA